MFLFQKIAWKLFGFVYTKTYLNVIFPIRWCSPCSWLIEVLKLWKFKTTLAFSCLSPYYTLFKLFECKWTFLDGVSHLEVARKLLGCSNNEFKFKRDHKPYYHRIRSWFIAAVYCTAIGDVNMDKLPNALKISFIAIISDIQFLNVHFYAISWFISFCNGCVRVPASEQCLKHY